MVRQYKTYKHYKGGTYLLLGEAMHTETHEALVVYVCATSGAMFCRPKAMFFADIKTETYAGPRFLELPNNLTEKR